MFVPDKATLKWARSCLVCGTKQEVGAGEIGEFLQTKWNNKVRVSRLQQIPGF